MRIALDAQGGDHGPHVTVDAAYHYLQNHPEDIVYLVGDSESISSELKKIPERFHNNLPVIHAPENIEMHESPTEAIKKKKNSSMLVGLKLHRDKEVDAFVSAGNTGAQMAGSLITLGRISDVKRPAIGAFLPSETGMVFMIDVGANVDSKPQHLLQFAIMANIFVSLFFEKSDLKVGLLNIGEEPSKGNDVSIAAYELFKEKLPNFYGNIEGGDIFKGLTEIIVCDGFVGNILLKTGENLMSVIISNIRKNIGKNLVKNFGAILVKPAFKALKDSFDYQQYGGVPLLGVDGISIICHGKSTPIAIKNALRVAKEMKIKEINKHIQENINTGELIDAKAS